MFAVSYLMSLYSWRRFRASYQGCTKDFLSAGANSAHLHRGLLHIDRISSWTFCFYPYTEGYL